MSEPDDSLDRQAAAREALFWVFRLRSGEMTEDDTAALLQWRARHPAHAQALSDAVKLRRRLADAAVAIAEEKRDATGPARNRRPILLGRRAFVGGALAASVGAVALVRPPLGLWPSLAEFGADYRTRTGERRTVELAQGVTVELNTRTSIARRGDPQDVRFELVEGEIAVEATHPAHAVAIQTGAGQVLASRARFNVRLIDAGTCVTCVMGSLSVLDRRAHAVTLTAGEQLTFDGRTEPVVVRVDLAGAEAWRRGLLVFNDRPLSEVISEINRYRSGRIILTNAALASFPITGTFQLARLDRAVAQIQQVAGAGATSLPGGVVLLG